MTSRDRETLIGAGVLLVGVAVLVLAYGGAGRASVAGYDLIARFHRADGIAVGSDVRLSGVSVGKVVGERLDHQFRAVVAMRVAPDIEVPDDSAALVQTDGLLGAKFIALQPGGSETNLKPGQELHYTQDSMQLEDLLAQIIAQGKSRRAAEQKP
jgi:phospholipid/cholesterol/gamma-HCH transport system substrate-binding protein